MIQDYNSFARKTMLSALFALVTGTAAHTTEAPSELRVEAELVRADGSSPDSSVSRTRWLKNVVFELGAARCNLDQGFCVMPWPKAGTHALSSDVPDPPTDPRYTLRLLGTSAGPLLRFEEQGFRSALAKSGTWSKGPLVVRFAIVPYRDPNEAKLGRRLKGTYFITSVWVRVFDVDSSEFTVERRVRPGEFKDTFLYLGDSVCQIDDERCVLHDVREGPSAPTLRAPEQKDFTVTIAPDSKPLQIYRKPWARVPRAKGWRGSPSITLEKRKK